MLRRSRRPRSGAPLPKMHRPGGRHRPFQAHRGGTLFAACSSPVALPWVDFLMPYLGWTRRIGVIRAIRAVGRSKLSVGVVDTLRGINAAIAPVGVAGAIRVVRVLAQCPEILAGFAIDEDGRACHSATGKVECERNQVAFHY